MIANALLRCGLYFVVLTGLSVPLGVYMARVYDGEAQLAQRVLGPMERLLYRLSGVREDEDMSWKTYAAAVLVFNLLGLLVVYVLQRVQGALPLNPQHFGAVTPEVSFNTAVSFASNTNWQAYGGESSLSYLTQMAALTVQNFVSAATGMAVLAALVRGFRRREASGIGNFWVDLTRSTLYVLLPLSLILALLLVSEGVVQTFGSYVTTVHDQTIALGPAASQIAIKQLGTNGGGFFNVNSAHPLENPTPLSNFLEVISILIVSGALCFTFGAMVKDRRQGWAVYAAMVAIVVPLLALCVWAEAHGNPLLSSLGIDSSLGNMEGKETRFGVVDSALWATVTTAASNGSVNAMHDSFMPLGGLVPMWLIQLGEVVFGGVGSGLYGMLIYAIIAVFIAGLMVGRTPEYLGKKIEAYEMKMASLYILLPGAAILVATAVAVMTSAGTAPVFNPGSHGFGEILYAMSSASQNNGSAFGGITVSGFFYATTQGVCMLIGRYWTIVPTLAIAGALAKKKAIPPSAGTLPTHGPLFVSLLVGTVLLVGALTFIPALAFGPVAEHFQLFGAVR